MARRCLRQQTNIWWSSPIVNELLAATRSGCGILARTMSEDPKTASAIELTRGAFAAANEADYDAMLRSFGPDSVWDVTPWGLGAHAGPAAIRKFLEGWIGSFDAYEVVVEELIDFGGGVVLAVATQYARPSGSREHLQLRYAPVFVWDEGAAVRVTHYRDIDEGRACARRLAERRRPGMAAAGRHAARRRPSRLP